MTILTRCRLPCTSGRGLRLCQRVLRVLALRRWRLIPTISDFTLATRTNCHCRARGGDSGTRQPHDMNWLRIASEAEPRAFSQSIFAGSWPRARASDIALTTGAFVTWWPSTTS